MELRAQLQELSGLASSPAGPLGAPRHMALQGPPLQRVGLKTVAFREGV